MTNTLTTKIKPCDTELEVLVNYDHEEFGTCIISVIHDDRDVLDYLHVNIISDMEYLIEQKHGVHK